MKKLLFILVVLGFISIDLLGQVYILNEDFSSATGNTPPNGWINKTISGEANDLWYFDNPGNRLVNYPISGKFAIFDSDNYSKNDKKEKVILESPYFDASISSNIILYFDHYFVGGNGGKGTIEAYNGFLWESIFTITETSSNPEKRIINISDLVGGVSNAKLRFVWESDSGYYWAIDNIKLFSPLSLDASIVDIIEPTMPFNAGNKTIKASFGNMGAVNLTSATIKWSVNGVMQSDYIWNGNLSIGEVVNLNIGNYDFISGKKNEIKVWQTNPNNGIDLNNQNDTSKNILYAALCGIYTIGGESADFTNFTDAVTVLNNAGVTCPVVFKVRNGTYNEQIEINKVAGCDSINTITFESESGDSSKAILRYNTNNTVLDYTIRFNGISYISFKNLSIIRGANSNLISIINNSNNLTFSNCVIHNNSSSTTRSSFSFSQTTNDILIENNNIRGTVGLSGNNIFVNNNITNSGIRITKATNTEIINNITNSEINITTATDVKIKDNTIISSGSGISITTATNTEIINNNINISSSSSSSTYGIYINNAYNVDVNNNSINITNSNSISGIQLTSTSKNICISENIINVANNYGIRALNNDNENINICKNNIKGGGIFLASNNGNGSYITENIIVKPVGVGIYINGNKIKEVSRNRIIGVGNNIGIDIIASDVLVANNFVQTEGLGSATGIKISNGRSNIKLVFNSVNVTNTNVTDVRALQVLGGSNLLIKNNIFANNGSGYAATISNDLTNSDIDYNNYYSSGINLFNFKGVNYSKLSDWGVAINGDANSFNVNPFFNSTTDLGLNHILLYQSGISTEGVSIDIDSLIRKIFPDIGAKEYSPCGVDAGINAIEVANPISVGSQSIKVILQNQGTENLSSAIINWSVNDIVQTPKVWSGNLTIKENIELVVGNYNFSSGIYNIKVWTSSPNGQLDCNNKNDTIRLNDITVCLCGIYTIGGESADFTNFTDAVTVLNNAGVTCPVVFKVRNGTYNEQIEINKVAGCDSINTITFESESGDSSKAILRYNTNNTVLDYTIRFNGISYISFKNLSIIRGANSNLISIINNSNNLTFSNCVIHNNSSSTTRSSFSFSQTTNDILIENNNIRGTVGLSGNNIFVNNNITNSGIRITKATNTEIINNITNSEINITTATDVKIKDNTIISSGSGISITTATNTEIINNNINISSSSSSSTYGIYINNAYNVDVNNNSINITNSNSISGIQLTSTSKNICISENIINVANNYGIRALNNDNENINICKNNIKGGGIFLASNNGNGSYITENIIVKPVGVGIYINGNKIKEVSRNRIIGVGNNIGIDIIASDVLVANNFVQTEGLGSATGIKISNGRSNIKLVFNSVNVTNTNVTDVRALQVLGGSNLLIKNNIFANNGSGYAATISNDLTNSDIDYNNYYSSGINLFNFKGVNYSKLSDWGVAINGDANSFNVNPFFNSTTDLGLNHILLYQSGISTEGVSIDIDSLIRKIFPDIGAKEYSPCGVDAGINAIEVANPISVGSQSIKVILQNQGTENLSSAIINWSVNDIVQTPKVWSGNLTIKENIELVVGNYNFSSGIYNIKVWTSSPNGQLDCNNKNDTIRLNDITVCLCGIYTIGGESADFTNFTDAVTVLNNAGVTCPVVFKVRNGTYNEQIEINKVAGCDSINTITFESESGDSSKAILRYNTNNTVLDYTIRFNGISYISFKNLSIIRGANSNLISIINNSNNLTFSNCVIHNNSSSTTRSSFSFSQTTNDILIENNNIRGTVGLSGNNIFVNNNITNSGIRITKATNTEIINNITNSEINITTATDVKIKDNTIISSGSGISITTATNTEIINNNINISSSSSSSTYGIYINNAYNVDVNNNSINITNSNSISGIQLTSTSKNICISENIINVANNYGIRALNNDNENINICKNNIKGGGIFLASNNGNGSYITENIIVKPVGVGIYINGNKIKEVSRNRIIGVGNNIGIDIIASDVLVANNFVQTEGLGSATGIKISNGRSNIKLVFNSVNVTNTNVTDVRALQVLGGSNLLIKNNIFANNGSGYAATISNDLTNSDIDYNNYYSSGINLFNFKGVNYSKLSDWGVAINGDANSFNVNPFFRTTTELYPYQRMLNGAGIPITEILIDIDGEIRNNQAPDIGADEFMVDFGITRLINPSLDCQQGTEEGITVMLRQYGDIPFVDLRLAYQMNNGTIYYDTVAGSINNDIEWTFKQTQDLSAQGTYFFKIWLVNASDDNVNNDTLLVYRYRKPSPVVDFTYSVKCAGESYPFYGTASVTPGSISKYEWDFGVNDSSVTIGQNPTYFYDFSGNYNVTLKAYSDEGCYTKVTKTIDVKLTPKIIETINNERCGNGEVLLMAKSDTGIVNWYSVAIGGVKLGEGNEFNTPIISVTEKYYVAAVLDGCVTPIREELKAEIKPLPKLAVTGSTILSGTIATVTAIGAEDYSWNIGSLNNSIQVTPTMTTTYYVTGTLGGCTASAEGVVVVVKEVIVVAGIDKAICQGESTILTATGTETYLWSTGDKTASVSVSPTITTTYIVTGTKEGFTATDRVIVTVKPLPVANAGTNKTIVIGSSTSLTATGGGTYSWSTGASTAKITVSPTKNTTYKVTVNLNGCTASDDVVVYVQSMDFSVDEDKEICQGESTTLTATGADNYIWSTGETTAKITVSPTITTIYSVTGTKLGVTAVDMVSVYLNNPPTVNAGANKNICTGASTSITATATNYDTLVWSIGVPTATITVSPTTTTTYKITATNNCGNVTDDIVVTVNPLPIANAGADKTIYTGASTSLTATGGGTYNWSTGETTATISVNPTKNTTYKVTVTLNGCTDSDYVVVTILSFSINAGANKEICRGASTSLTATGADSYQWSTGATTATISLSPTVTTTYIVTGTKQGATASDEVIVTVNQLPIISAGANKTICFGTYSTLTSTGGLTYLWSTGEGTATITVTPTINTIYSVTGTDANACTNTSIVTVIVNSLPVANAENDITIINGETANLIATGGDTYLWSNNVETAFNAVTPTETTTYTVTASKNGCTASDMVVVTVKDIVLAIERIFVFRTSCYEGSDGRIVIRVSGGVPPYSYIWSNGMTGDTITGLARGEYTVTIKDQDDNETVVNATMTSPNYLEMPTIYVTNITNIKATLNWNKIEGGNTYMVRYREGNTVVWSYVNLSSLQTNIELNNLKENAEYEWQMRALKDNSTYSCFTDLDVFKTASANTCGITTNLRVEDITAGTAEVKWDFDNNASRYLLRIKEKGKNDNTYKYYYIDGGESSFVLNNLSLNTTYEYQIRKFCNDNFYSDFTDLEEFTTKSSCPKPEDLNIRNLTATSVVLQWNAHPDALVLMIRLREVGTDTWKYYTRGNAGINKNALQVGCIICESVHKLKPNTDYEWQIRAFCNPSRSIYSDFTALHTFTTSSIDLNLGNDRTICKGQTIGIRTNINADNYLWSNGAETSYISVSPITTTTYTLSATIDGVINSQSIVVYVNDVPEVSAGADQTVCSGKIVNIKATGANSYEWNTGSLRDEVTFIPITTTTYTVTGINSYNCTAEASVVVEVNTLPYVNAGADVFICEGQTASLNATGGGTYSWNSGETDPIINVSPTLTSYYVVTADNGNCTASDMAVVVVSPISTSSSGDVNICQGDITMLSATGGVNYEWTTGQKLSSIYVNPTITTTYTVTIKNATGCSAVETIVVNVSNDLSVDAGSDITICKGKRTSITVSANNPTAYRWSTGSLRDKIAVAPIQTTTYTVTVYSGNCFDTDEVVVYVINCKNEIIDNGKLIIDNSSFSINVYPNPSYDGKLNIEVNGLEADTKLTLMSYTGAILLERTVNKGDSNQELDISTFANGIMFIRIGTETFKVVKN